MVVLGVVVVVDGKKFVVFARTQWVFIRTGRADWSRW
jgi:hypothetical protein